MSERAAHADLGVFIPSFEGGGAEKTFVNLANSFALRGFDVDLVVANPVGPWAELVDASVQVHGLDQARVSKAVPRLAAYLRNRRPSTMISALTHANLAMLTAARLSRYTGRKLISERNSLSHVVAANNLKSNLRARAIRMLYPSSDGLICASRAMAEEFRGHLRRSAPEIRVIYNPIDLERCSQLAAEDPDPVLTTERDDTLVAVGRLSDQKDFATLVSAFSKSSASKTSTLYIIGEGPNRAALQSLAERLGVSESVRMPGFLPNVHSVLSRAKLFVLSSRYEGMPNAMLEAIASGCRVVSTDCPTGPAEIMEGFDVGRLVPVGDADAMAQAIDDEMFSDHPRPDRNVLNRFSPEVIVDAYERALFGTAKAEAEA